MIQTPGVLAPEYALLQTMTDGQRVLFLTQYNGVRKDGTIGVLLALFLGGFGAHRFYLGQTGLGILYLCFFWLGLPHLIALVECFLMPGRVRAYNARQAEIIALHVRNMHPGTSPSSYPPGPALPPRGLMST